MATSRAHFVVRFDPRAWAEDVGDRYARRLSGGRTSAASFLDGRRLVQWEPDGPVELCLPGQS